MASVRRINLRFTSEDFDKINEKRFRWRVSFQELGMRLFDDWLRSEGAKAAQPCTPLAGELAA